MQPALLLGLGALLTVITAVLARRDLLSMRFVVAWAVIGCIIAVTGPIAEITAPFVQRIGMTPTGLLLGVVSAVLLGVCLQLSFDASQTRRKVQDLAEANALLRAEVDALRERLDSTDADPRPEPGPGAAPTATLDPTLLEDRQ